MLIAFIQPMMLGNALGIVLNRVSTHNLIQYECHNSTLLLNEGIPREKTLSQKFNGIALRI